MSTVCTQCSELIPAGVGFCEECGAASPKKTTAAAAKPKPAAAAAPKPAAAATAPKPAAATTAPASASGPVTTKIDCNNCGERIPSSAKFCPECGGNPSAVKAADVYASRDACTQCGSKIPPNAKFCPECGKAPGKAEAKAPAGVAATGNTCKGCGKGFDQGVYITALGGKWHSGCFNCQDCATPIQSQSFTVNNGKPLCDNCVKKRKDDHLREQSESTLKCTGCGKGIMGRYVKPEGKAFHSECFKCMAGCGTALKDGYVLKGSEMLCGNCARANRQAAPAPQAAAAPQPKISVEAGSITCIKCFNTFAPTLSKCPSCGKPPTAGQLRKVQAAGGAVASPAAPKAAGDGGGGGGGGVKFCGECGTKSTGARFCGECGSAV